MMDNAARKLDGQGAIQQVGVVRTVGATLSVGTEDGDYTATRAVSCLVEPEVGDFVLLSITETAGCYVLAVLEREQPGAVTLKADGDLKVQLPNGQFTVAAQQGVSMASAGEVSVLADKLKVRALEGSVVLDKLNYLGRWVHSEVDKVKSVARTFDSVLERFSQRVKRSYRTVQEFDQVKAERVDYAAKKVMRLHGGNMVVTANQLVKMDGEQIHLG